MNSPARTWWRSPRRATRRPTSASPSTPTGRSTCARSPATTAYRRPPGPVARSRATGTAMGAALAGRLEPHGYAVSRGALEADITAIAVPVRDYHDEIVAALSILAPSYRTDDAGRRPLWPDARRSRGRSCPQHSARARRWLQLRFPEPPLSDGVVALRPWEPSDLDFVVQACQDPEVSRYSPVIPFPYVEADAAGWFDSQEPTRLAGDALDFAVADAADRQAARSHRPAQARPQGVDRRDGLLAGPRSARTRLHDPRRPAARRRGSSTSCRSRGSS